MCDYSLMGLPNRLATVGDELVVYQFGTGSLGLASAPDVIKAQKEKSDSRHKVWRAIVEFFDAPAQRSVCAVCIPPGARLLMRDFAPAMRASLGLQDDLQEVTFTQQHPRVGFRDSIRFSNGKQVLLQLLKKGQRVTVLALSSDEHHEAPVDVEVRFESAGLRS